MPEVSDSLKFNKVHFAWSMTVNDSSEKLLNLE